MKTPKLTITDTGAGKNYVISDIHGCFETFHALVQKIALQKDDRLFLLGDYMNRGPKSKEVIDFILQLMNKGYSIYPLKGNHEDLAQTGYGVRKYNMTDAAGKPMDRYMQFFADLYYYIELENTFLVHAGFNFESNNPFEDYESMLWTKKNYQHINPNPHKRIIHGHFIKPLDNIQAAVQNQQMWISLDNGCYQKNRHQYGNLCCLELNDFQLTVQENVDEMEGWRGHIF
jgi:serine/threonine protein phosphatase 1